jgi:hypothetical protein
MKFYIKKGIYLIIEVQFYMIFEQKYFSYNFYVLLL